jgi:hypothetical protein
MKRVLRMAALLLVALGATACATTTMVQVWRDPNYKPTPVKSVLVIAIIPQTAYKHIYEEAVAQAFRTQGFQATPSSNVFPPGELDREKVVAYVKAQQVDLVVAMHLSRQTDVQYVSPTMQYAPPPLYYGGWYGYYGYGYRTVYSPGYYAENITVVAETNVYSAHAEPEPLVWSGSSSTFNFSRASDTASSVASALVTDLAKAGILIK